MQAKTGHKKEFEAALQRLRGQDADISLEAAEIQVLICGLYTGVQIDNGLADSKYDTCSQGLCHCITGLYRNSATAPKSQNSGSVSKKILTFCHCNFLFPSSFQKFIFFWFQLISFKKNCVLHMLSVSIFSLLHNLNCPFFGNQIGVGLMFFQQFGGINGICFYTSNIFESAGTFFKRTLQKTIPTERDPNGLVRSPLETIMQKKENCSLCTNHALHFVHNQIKNNIHSAKAFSLHNLTVPLFFWIFWMASQITHLKILSYNIAYSVINNNIFIFVNFRIFFHYWNYNLCYSSGLNCHFLGTLGMFFPNDPLTILWFLGHSNCNRCSPD